MANLLIFLFRSFRIAWADLETEVRLTRIVQAFWLTSHSPSVGRIPTDFWVRNGRTGYLMILY